MSTEETVIEIRDENIRLGQALKKACLVQSGADAKAVIRDGFVLVNGDVCTERGRKLRNGDCFTFDGKKIRVISDVS